MLPGDARDRLAKVVLLLSSDQPGEVVAARDAIARLLAAYGSDWHGLAALIAPPVLEGDPVQVLLGDLAERITRPSDREWIARLSRFYAQHGRLSERQMQVLADIADRYCRHGR